MVIPAAVAGGCCSGRGEEAFVRNCSAGACRCEEPGTTLSSPGASGQPSGLVAATFRIDGLGCSCERQIVEKRVRVTDWASRLSA